MVTLQALENCLRGSFYRHDLDMRDAGQKKRRMISTDAQKLFDSNYAPAAGNVHIGV